MQDGALADVIADLTTQQVDASPVAEVKDEEALKSAIPPAAHGLKVLSSFLVKFVAIPTLEVFYFAICA